MSAGNSAGERRGWTPLFVLGAGLSVLQLWLSPHVASMDLPEHLAAMSTLRHFDDASWHLREHVTLEALGRTNYVLYHLVGALLTAALGSAERANMLMLSLVAVSLPFAARALFVALGRDARIALVACTLFWSRPLAEGLVAFVTSAPIVLFALSLVVAQLARPTQRRAAGMALLGIIVFYLHPVSFGLLAAGAAWLTVVLGPAKKRFTGAPRRLLWLLPAVAVGFYYGIVRAAAPVDPSGVVHGRVLTYISRLRLLGELQPWLHDFWRSPWDDVLGWVLWGSLAWLAVARRKHAEDLRGKDDPEGRAATGLAMLALALYLALPTQIGSPQMGILTQIDQRVSLFVGLLLPLVVPPAAPRRHDSWDRLALTLVATSVVGLGLHGCFWARIYEANEAQDLDRVIADLPRGKRVLGLSFHANSRYATVAPFVHSVAYVRARLGGVSSPSFVNVPHWPIHYRPGAAPPVKDDLVWEYHPCAFDNAVDGPYFDFVLVRGPMAPFAGDPPGPRFRARARAGEFTLFERAGGYSPERPGVFGPCPANSAMNK